MGCDITILVGTMTGTAEMVAQEVQQALEVAGHQATIKAMDGLDTSVFRGGGAFLICTSTYGQGDVPDNAQALFSSLESEKPDLTGVTYGVIALGDRTYKDTYCHGGIRFDKLLTSLGAKRAGEILTHDASSGTLPEEVAAQWVVPWAEQHLASSLGDCINMAGAVTHQRGEVLVDGKRLETLWIAPSDKHRPTIVMLHEGLGSVALWKDFPQRLASRTGSGILVYSRYGHGNSDQLLEKRPVEFMHHEGEVVLPELLDKLSIAKPILLGHSDGGSIALIFAGKYPDQPRALMLEAPHVFVEDLSVASITQAKVTYLTTDLPRKLGRYHQHVDATFWGWNDIWLDPQFRSWNIEEYLPVIRCPILCIQGEEDEYGTIAQVKAVQTRVPATEILMLPNCKHSPHRDQTEATLEKMAEYMALMEGSEEAARVSKAAGEEQ